MKAFDEFLAWEAASKDTIDFKRAYVDVVGDVLAGLVLAELIYWHLPSKKTGAAKMKVRRGDHHWIACNRADWWERTRLTARQFDAALKLLTDASIAIKEVHGFAAKRALYVRINETVFLERLSVVITEDIYRYYPEVKPRRRPTKSQISDYGDKSQIGDLPPEINHKSVTSNTTTTSSSTTEKSAAIAAQVIEQPSKESTKRPIFDAIALGSWGIQDSSAVNGNGGRIGKLEAWVKKTYPGATEKTIDAFYKWWKRSNPKASAPRDLDKFSDNFIAFHQAMTAKQAAESVPAPEPEPVITEADRAESLAILRAARGKVSA
jgi:hypothetical protein